MNAAWADGPDLDRVGAGPRRGRAAARLPGAAEKQGARGRRATGAAGRRRARQESELGENEMEN